MRGCRTLLSVSSSSRNAFDVRDGNDLARQLRLLDMRVRDVLKKLANDEQALVAVAERLGVPIRYLGIGEAAEDLDVFRAAPFVEALIHGGEDEHRRRA